MRPSCCMHGPLEMRAQGRPGARLHPRPPCVKKARGRNHRCRRNHPAFPARRFYALYALSPGTGLFCSCREQIVLLTWPQRREARTTRFRRPPRRRRPREKSRAPPKRPSHPRLTCRDDRDTSLFHRGGTAATNHRFLKNAMTNFAGETARRNQTAQALNRFTNSVFPYAKFSRSEAPLRAPIRWKSACVGQISFKKMRLAQSLSIVVPRYAGRCGRPDRSISHIGSF